MSYEDQRRRYQRSMADRELVDQAAAELRHRAISDAYSGLEGKFVAFGLALILDELARHLRDLDEQLQANTLACCRRLLRKP
jgi:hypothetical protein